MDMSRYLKDTFFYIVWEYQSPGNPLNGSPKIFLWKLYLTIDFSQLGLCIVLA